LHTIYEYLFTALIIVTIVIAASTMLMSMSNPLKMVSEREQLKVTAEKLLGQMLLSTGEPEDWGTNLTSMTTFGLAKQSSTTRESFVLDPDKAQRLSLNASSPFAIAPENVSKLLKLGHTVDSRWVPDYGFAIEIFPVLNVTVRPAMSQEVPPGEGSKQWYTVIVANNEGLPVANANVTGRMYYVTSNHLSRYDQTWALTGVSGSCVIGFGEKKTELADMRALVVVADYYGTRIVKVARTTLEIGGASERSVPATLLGNDLILDGSYSPNGSNVIQVMVWRRGNQTVTADLASGLNAPIPAGSQNRYTVLQGGVEPSTVALVSIVNQTSTDYLAVGSVTVNLAWPNAYSTLSPAGQSSLGSFPLGVQLQRVVTIADQTYVFRLYVWRMVW